MKESTLVTRCLRVIREADGWATKINTGSFGTVGTPDILACVAGRFLAVEVKVGRNPLTAPQALQLRRIAEAGGIAMVVVDDEEMLVPVLASMRGLELVT